MDVTRKDFVAGFVALVAAVVTGVRPTAPPLIPGIGEVEDIQPRMVYHESEEAFIMSGMTASTVELPEYECLGISATGPPFCIQSNARFVELA